MILTASAIRDAIGAGDIVIKPFDEAQLNPNSYNLCLASTLGVYLPHHGRTYFRRKPRRKPVTLDCKTSQPVEYFEIPEDGFVIRPGKLYLGSTVEFTGTNKYVPMIEGRSSLARLGLSVHQTGGFGDIGFHGHWTLEIACVEPVRIYAGIKVCQLQFWIPSGAIDKLYQGKYLNQVNPEPSKLYKELEHDTGTD